MQGHRAIEVGIIEVRGEEARDWLQGQVTASVLGDAPVYSLLLTPKGRVVSDGWIVPRGSEALDFVVPRHASEDAFARLDRFLVMEDVELALREATIFHIVGAEPPDGVPTNRIGLPGFDASAPIGPAIDDVGWMRRRIEAGIPELGRDFGADTLPQEAGLKHAVSFDKGCYIGQEPVVMLEHRGQPPRRMARVRVGGDPELPAEITADGKPAGSLTSACEGIGLALIKRKRLDDALRVGEARVEVLAILGDGD